MPNTYLLNGVDLDVNTYGWTLLGESKPHPGISPRTVELTSPGVDGNIPVPTSADSPVIVLTEQVPDTSNRPFLALCGSPSLVLGHDGFVAAAELISLTPDDRGFDYTDYDVSFRIPGMAWRDPAVHTETTLLTAANQNVQVFTGGTAPANDALIRVAGGVTGLRVTDSAGDWFQYLPTIPAGSFLRFDCSTGLAWITTTDTWTGGTPVLVDLGPGPRVFQLTPIFGATIAAQVSVTSTALASSPAIAVRGALAHRI